MKSISLILCFSSLFLTSTITIFGQNPKQKKILYHEVPDDAYIPVDRNKMPKSPAYHYTNSTVFTTQVNIDADGNNIVGDAANEPSIAYDPTNPNRIVIGWRQFDTISSNFRQAGYAYSLDAGNTWTFPGPIEPSVFRSDPVLDFDIYGNFYYNSLGYSQINSYACHVFRIEDAGVEWDNGTYAFGGDKQWMRIDKTDGIGSSNNYSFWTASSGDCYPGGFTRSTNAGDHYESCSIVPDKPMWGTLAVGPQGELYLVGEAIYIITLVKSTTAKDPAEDVTWDFSTSVNLDGIIASYETVNPGGLLGQVWVDTDNSDGPGQGNVYVLATVKRNSNNDPADVMFAKSTNGGITFESPIRINTDASIDNYQWFGTMSVAPNGRIDVVWLDTRDAPTNSPHDSALYYSYSLDQGITWSINEKISGYFDPHIGYPNQNKMGDYFDMKSDNGGAHLAWANTLNEGQDVYYSYITPAPIGVHEISNSIYQKVTNYPNPFSERTTISFSLAEESHVSIEIFNLMGKKLTKLIDKKLASEKHNFIWEAKDAFGNKLSNGLYIAQIKIGENTIYKKMLLNY